MPEQGAVGPLMAPGVAGNAVTVIVLPDAVLLEQLLLATTEMFPPVFPETALIVFDVEDPVHPAGNVHVYDVAPGTRAME